MDSKKIKMYKRYLREYMSFCTGESYRKDHVFPKEELHKVTAECFVRWLTLKAFGKVEIGPRDKPIL
jgi:hypothetical protein